MFQYSAPFLKLDELASNFNLSVRTRNVCSDNGLDSLPKILEFYSKYKSFTQLKNAGNKTHNELETLCWHFLDHEDQRLLLTYFIANKIGLSLEIVSGLLPKNEGEFQFSLFKFLDRLFVNEILFDKRRIFILRHRFCWWKDKSTQMNLEEIGNQLGITRQRVLQLENDLLKKDIQEKFQFLSERKDWLLQLTDGGYRLDIEKDIVLISPNLVETINDREETAFSLRFFSKIFSLIYADSHTLFGDGTVDKKNENHQQYLIRHELIKDFNFELFVSDIRKREECTIEAHYNLDLKTHILKFFKGEKQLDILPRILEVCIDIVRFEFDASKVFFDDSDGLAFCRNTPMRPYEYAMKVLEDEGKPTKLNDIHKAILKQNPDFKTNLEGLRGALGRKKTIFKSYGRNSIYGLLKWDIKGGSIRDLIKDFLSNESFPRHYYDITQYVLLHHPDTSSKSVHSNLQLDKSGRFQNFPNGFWGLTEREYPDFNTIPLPRSFKKHIPEEVLKILPDSFDRVARELAKKFSVETGQVKAYIEEKILSPENDEPELTRDNVGSNEIENSVAIEGEKRLREYLATDRNRKIVIDFKKWLQTKKQELKCEICDMSFEKVYGKELGAGFIEAHHKKPLAELQGEQTETKFDDLAAVCSNCHQMLHRKNPPFTVDELRLIVKENRNK